MTRVRIGKPLSRKGGQEPRLAGEVGGCEERGGSIGQASRQEDKGPPEHGWKVSFGVDRRFSSWGEKISQQDRIEDHAMGLSHVGELGLECSEKTLR